MKRLIVTALAGLLTGSVLATDYYVDAENGSDANDGLTAATARQTLAKAMELAGVGDTVYAAEGTYDEGTMTYSGITLPSRVVISRGRRLVASGARAKTIIKGQGPNGESAIRCVLLEGKSGDVPGGIIRGFTITGGATRSEGDSNNETRGGGLMGLNEWNVYGNGLAVDCDIHSNVSQNGAPNVYCCVLLRCHVVGSWTDMHHSAAIDSVLDASHSFDAYVQLYNCTYTSSQSIDDWSKSTNVKNCLFTNAGYTFSSGVKYSSCHFRAAKPETTPADTTFDSNCRFGVTEAELAMLVTGGLEPSKHSVVMEKGDASLYAAATASWPASWKAELTGKDYGGNARLRDGKIDIGAYQCTEGPDYYVDAENGSDANDGLTAATARQTLAKAMELAVGRCTVHAAEGTYDAGSMAYDGCAISSRVVVRRGVRLVATGRQSQTVIKGQGPIGADAIRCVLLEGGKDGVPGGVVRGFTITGGHTEANGYGGGVSGLTQWSLDGNGLAVDCHIYGNAASRGPNVYTTTLLRCRVGTSLSGDYDLFANVKAIDSLYEGDRPPYQQTRLVNCTYASEAHLHSIYAGQSVVKDCVFTNPKFQFGNLFAFQNCFFAAEKPASTSSTFDSACRFGIGVGVLGVRVIPDKVFVSTNAAVLARGIAADRDAETASWNAAWKEELTGVDLNGNARFTDGTISLGCCEQASPRGFYADAANGNDANDGLSAATAKKTLAAAMALAEAYDVVYAAEGTYDEGTMTYDGCAISNRVVIRRGRQLIATGAREKTIIRGGGSLGVDPVRCVLLEDPADGLEGGIVEGFTITGGRTNASGNDIDARGGGVSGIKNWTHDHGYAINCDIRNNNAYTSPNVNCANLIRCTVGASWADIAYSFAFGCVIETSHSTGPFCHLFNCTLTGTGAMSDANVCTRAYNCLFTNPAYGTTGVGVLYTNCSFRASEPATPGKDTTFGGCRFSLSEADVALDAASRPAVGSAAVDSGDAALYRNMHTEIDRYKDWDIAGGQRVYNGCIDVGAGECDMRGEYARVLNRRRATVTVAAPSLVKDGAKLVFADGSYLESSWTVTAECSLDFVTAIDGTGTLTVTLNGTPVTAAAAGRYSVTLPQGTSTLAFRYVGTGTATASDFHCNGFVVIVR